MKKQEMTPEQFFQSQKVQVVSDQVAQRVEPKPRRVLTIKKVEPVQQVVEELPEMPILQKVDLIAKGLVYTVWTMTLMLSAVLILVGVLYQFPLNIAIIIMAGGLDVLAFYTMKKYMRV